MNSTKTVKSSPPQFLSVILAVYNAAKTIHEQLEALKAQIYEGEWEIIIVNNCSTDNTIEVVQAYQVQMPHLHLVHAMEKQGRAYACNVGAQSARGDALIFCDADDIVTPGWLPALAKALETYEVVAGALDLETLNQAAPQRPPAYLDARTPILDFLPYAVGCNFGVSRQAFEAVGGYSEEFVKGQDVDISWRLQLHGYPIGDAPEAIVRYRYRETLWGVWKQFMKIGYFQTLTYVRFAPYGMPRSSIRKTLQRYKKLLKPKRVARVLLRRASRPEQARWVWEAAIYFGRLWGSIRHRTLYL